MNYNISFIAFGTFGNPNGFKQTFFIGEDLSKSIKTFDLNTNAIQLFPQSEIFSMRKEFMTNNSVISYAKYTFAKEPNSDRSGTFVGSAIIYVNEIAKEILTLNNLNEFHEKLVKNNVIDSIINVSHSDAFSVVKPVDYDKISFNLNKIKEFTVSAKNNNNLVVYCDTDSANLQNLFHKSIDLLNVYDTIYFTKSQEVATFVQQKGIYKLIQHVGDLQELDKEILKLKEEENERIQLKIQEFQNEKNLVVKDQNRIIEEFNTQLQKNEKLHSENQTKLNETKNKLQLINGKYAQYSTKIDDFINQFEGGKKFELIKQHLEEYKRNFVFEMNQLTKNESINSLPNQKISSNLHVNNSQDDLGFYKNSNDHRNQNKINKAGYYKLATFFLAISLIGAIGYFYFFYLPQKDKEMKDFKDSYEATKQEELDSVIKLNPKPNTEKANKIKLIPNQKIKDAMDVLFKNDSTHLNEYYKHQKSDYSNYFYNTNKNNFETIGLDTILKDTSNVIIPTYAKQ